MPRHKSTKPTSIYWLYDTRPETINTGWPDGQPFYCGKTTQKPKQRLYRHRRQPYGKAGPRIIACGEFIRIQIVEIIPSDGDWQSRESFWIYTMRLLWPDCCLNLSDGGDGAPGFIHTANTRAKMSIAARNRSPETLAKMSAARQGMQFSLEHRTNLSIAAKNRTSRPKGYKRPPETIAKMRAANLGKKISPETRSKISASTIGKRKSLEHRASLRLAQQRRAAERASS